MNETLTFAIPTLFGLESLAADELRRLDLPQVRAENGRVLCGGTLGDIPRLNVNLRTGERVLFGAGGPSQPETSTHSLRGPERCLGSDLSPGMASSR